MYAGLRYLERVTEGCDVGAIEGSWCKDHEPEARGDEDARAAARSAPQATGMSVGGLQQLVYEALSY